MTEYSPYKTKAIEEKLVSMREKIFRTHNISDYNGQEQEFIKACYYEQGYAYSGRGKILANGCSSCFKDAIKLLRNHLTMREKRYIEPTIKKIEKRKVPQLESLLEVWMPKTKKDYEDALKHIGVPRPRGATKAELRKLWEDQTK